MEKLIGDLFGLIEMGRNIAGLSCSCQACEGMDADIAALFHDHDFLGQREDMPSIRIRAAKDRIAASAAD